MSLEAPIECLLFDHWTLVSASRGGRFDQPIREADFALAMTPCPSAPPAYRGLLCLVVCLLLAACMGDDPTTGTTKVEGQVVQRQTRQPVGGGTVQVYLAGKAGNYGPVGDPQPCDAQGRFSFAFDAARKRGYLLLAQASPGCTTDWAEAPELTAGRDNKSVVSPVLSPAWVRLVPVDGPPKSRVLMTTAGYSDSGDQLRHPKDTALIRPILADFRQNMAWFINDQGKDSQSYQEIQPAALGTVTVRIPF